jgi:hypothetical protein
MDTRYPDISGIIAKKARGRNERARLSFGEKLEILDRMRTDIEPIVRARRERYRVSMDRKRDSFRK